MAPRDYRADAPTPLPLHLRQPIQPRNDEHTSRRLYILSHLRVRKVFLDLGYPPALLGCIRNLGLHLFLLGADMRPSQFFLQLVYFRLLLSSLGSLFIPIVRFAVRRLEIGDGLLLLREDFGRGGDIGDTSFVFFRELGKLGTAEKELQERISKQRRNKFILYLVLVCWSRCAEELSGSV